MKKTKLLSLSVALSAMNLCSANGQTTTLDYTTVNESNNCHIFGSGYTFNGINHQSTVGGQSLTNAVYMPGLNQFAAGQRLGSEFELSYNFKYGHTYKIGVSGLGLPVTVAMRVEIGDPAGTTSVICGPGGVAENPSGPYAYYFNLSATSVTNFTHNFTLNEDRSRLRLTHVTIVNPQGPIPTAVIKKITIEDISVNAPDFKLTSSVNSRFCGTNNPVTFTVQNINSTPGVTSYRFDIEPGKWLLPNGLPAPASVTTTSNTLTLTPIACGGAGYVSGRVFLGAASTGLDPLTISVKIPGTFDISGPSVLASSAGIYNLVDIVSGNPISLPCNATTTWTLTPSDIATVSVYNPFQVSVVKNARGPLGNVVLRATINMCNTNFTYDKPISIVSLIASPLINLKEQSANSIYPNPNNGIFEITFNKPLQDAQLIVQSVNGSLIIDKKISGQKTELDISKAPAGIYIIKVVNGSEVTTEKVVKK